MDASEKRAIVIIEGGNVQSIYSNNKDISIEVLDWDHLCDGDVDHNDLGTAGWLMEQVADAHEVEQATTEHLEGDSGKMEDLIDQAIRKLYGVTHW